MSADRVSGRSLLPTHAIKTNTPFTTGHKRFVFYKICIIPLIHTGSLLYDVCLFVPCVFFLLFFYILQVGMREDMRRAREEQRGAREEPLGNVPSRGQLLL